MSDGDKQRKERVEDRDHLLHKFEKNEEGSFPFRTVKITLVELQICTITPEYEIKNMHVMA